MHRHLAVQRIGNDPALTVVQRDTRLVAGRFDAKNQHARMVRAAQLVRKPVVPCLCFRSVASGSLQSSSRISKIAGFSRPADAYGQTMEVGA